MFRRDGTKSNIDIGESVHDERHEESDSSLLSPSRRRIMMVMLTLIYAMNYMDRQIIVILQEPIKAAFGLHDWQLGLVTGVVFGLFYTAAGMPIAHWLDQGVKRTRVIAVLLAAWSVLTAMCGLSQNFIQFCMARMGVGLAEAGFAPAAHSLISDLYSERERPRAMGSFAVGTPIGMMAGLSIGGLVAHYADWRTALLLVGLPGVIVAVLFHFVSREPVRGASEPHSHKEIKEGANVGFWPGLLMLLRNRAIFHLLMGTSLAVLVLAAVASWLPSLLIRLYGISLPQAGVSVGVLYGLCGILGTTIGGWQATRLGKKGRQAALVIPTVALALAVPLFILAMSAGKVQYALLLLSVPVLFGSLFIAPTIALFQTLAPVRMRARASAIAIVTQNLIGMSLGPLLVGLLSDYFTAARGGDGGLGLRDALWVIVALLGWAVIHLTIAMRELASQSKVSEQIKM